MDLKVRVDKFMEEEMANEINVDLLFEHVKDSILMEDDNESEIAELFAKDIFVNAFIYTAGTKDINRAKAEKSAMSNLSHVQMKCGRDYLDLINKSLNGVGETIQSLEIKYPGVAAEISNVGVRGIPEKDTQVLPKVKAEVGEFDIPLPDISSCGSVMIKVDELTDHLLNHSMDI